MPRSITSRYDDPLDLIWLKCAGDFGMNIERSHEVFASWNGHDTLTLGLADTLDADDCLAQMVLHECCHAIAEGPESWHKVDWGLRMDRPEQRIRELVCLRIQAAITRPFGLTDMLGSTTNLRSYYDSLPANPLAIDINDPAADMARAAFESPANETLIVRLQTALKKTRQLADLIQEDSDPRSIWSRIDRNQAFVVDACRSSTSRID